MHRLIPHPNDPAVPVAEVTVVLERSSGGLRLTYRIRGEGLILPEDFPAGRCDDLWRHTCCELFLAEPGATRYREFNFSPAGAWAAYDFSDYRARGTPPEGPPPLISCVRLDDGFRLEATLAASWLPSARTLKVGLTAVLEDAAGRFGYWALHHPADRPDFHHADGFVLTLDPLP